MTGGLSPVRPARIQGGMETKSGQDGACHLETDQAGEHILIAVFAGFVPV